MEHGLAKLTYCKRPDHISQNRVQRKKANEMSNVRIRNKQTDNIALIKGFGEAQNGILPVENTIVL